MTKLVKTHKSILFIKFSNLAKNERLSSVLRDWQYRGLREANSLEKIYEIVSLEKLRTTLIRGRTVKQV